LCTQGHISKPAMMNVNVNQLVLRCRGRSLDLRLDYSNLMTPAGRPVRIGGKNGTVSLCLTHTRTHTHTHVSVARTAPSVSVQHTHSLSLSLSPTLSYTHTHTQFIIPIVYLQ